MELRDGGHKALCPPSEYAIEAIKVRAAAAAASASPSHNTGGHATRAGRHELMRPPGVCAQLGSTAVGIQVPDGVLLAVEKRITSPLLERIVPSLNDMESTAKSLVGMRAEAARHNASMLAGSLLEAAEAAADDCRELAATDGDMRSKSLDARSQALLLFNASLIGHGGMAENQRELSRLEETLHWMSEAAEARTFAWSIGAVDTHYTAGVQLTRGSESGAGAADATFMQLSASFRHSDGPSHGGAEPTAKGGRGGRGC